MQCSRLIPLMIGIYDYRNRVYSPDLGRFLQTDPIRFDAGDVNIYRYVGNGVTRLKDPYGLCADDEEEEEEKETAVKFDWEGLRDNYAYNLDYLGAGAISGLSLANTGVLNPVGLAGLAATTGAAIGSAIGWAVSSAVVAWSK